MYSKNDYRYYLESNLYHSDDFLAHYGVKGMKWKQHKKGPVEDVVNIARSVRDDNAKNDANKITKNVANTANKVSKSVPQNKKKTLKKRVSNIRKKYGLYRSTPKGKKLKGGGNIYVSHE